MQNANDRNAATPPFEDVKPTIPADAWKLPPLANVGTGVVRLRNEEEVPVQRNDGDAMIEEPAGRRRAWALSGERRVGGRFPEDIVAQVSVGPTGPGRYETVGGIVRHVTHRDERGWRADCTFGWTDDFGRAYFEDGARCVEADIRRRIGDLPVPDAVPVEVQEFAAAVERATEAAKSAEPYRDACERMLGVAKRVVLSDGREGVVFANEDLPPLLVALAAAAGKRDEAVPEAVAVELSTTDSQTEARTHPIGTGLARYRCRNGKTRYVYGLSDMGYHLSYAVPITDHDGKSHDYLPDGRERAGNREWDIVGYETVPADVQQCLDVIADSTRDRDFTPSEAAAYERAASRPVSTMLAEQLPVREEAVPPSEWEKSMEDVKAGRTVPVEQAIAELKASDGRAAMDAMWGDGVPTVDLRTREWLREMVREAVAADVIANRRGLVVMASPERFALSEADLVPVSRDDLRVLFDTMFREIESDFHGHNPNGVRTYPSEADFRALSRAAAALGETLPEWMREHARKEGWAT